MNILNDINGKSILARCLMVVAIFLIWGNLAHGAGLLVSDGGFGGVLEMKEHTVQVTINNGIAVTEVNQVFLNTENRQLEALYTFPVPKGASVANFSMWINGSEMVGEVIEKERAREIYNSYKQRRRDPGLLEQVDFRTFEMRIFPIAPNAEQRVQISYYQELNHDNDWATFVYPLATATRPGVDDRVRGKFAMTLQIRSEIPIVEIESPSHRDDFVFAQHSDNFSVASLEAFEGNLARDVVIAYHMSRPKTGVDVITSRQKGEDGFFCMTITAGEELEGLKTGMDYVFVLDISGSMGNDRKLETSTNSVGAFIEALGDEDRFEVTTFNIEATTLFGKLEFVSDATVAQAVNFLDTREAKGGTVLRSALQTAYRYADPDGDRQLNVIVLSDGLTEQKDRSDLLRLVDTRPKNSRVFCIGVGNDINRQLLEQVAEEAGGLVALISRGDDFDRQAQAFQRKLTKPVATGLQIDFSDAEIYDVIPEVAPNLYHGTPVRLYGRYKGTGTVNAKLSADISGYGFDQTIEITLPAEDSKNPEIERMWAWHRVQRLQKQADRNGSRDNVVDEIVKLGEAYSIATEYTSFLVLENNAEYKRWKIKRHNTLRLERDRNAQRRLRDELDAIRQAAVEGLGPIQEAKKNVAQSSAKRVAPQVSPTQRTAAPRQQVARRDTQGQGWDFNLPSGGGAIDPVSGSIALGLAGLAAMARKKKK